MKLVAIQMDVVIDGKKTKAYVVKKVGSTKQIAGMLTHPGKKYIKARIEETNGIEI